VSAREFARAQAGLVQSAETQALDDAIVADGGRREPVNKRFDTIHQQ
jgi:hypothetical protein